MIGGKAEQVNSDVGYAKTTHYRAGAVVHLASYVGWPKAISAMAVATGVFGEQARVWCFAGTEVRRSAGRVAVLVKFRGVAARPAPLLREKATAAGSCSSCRVR